MVGESDILSANVLLVDDEEANVLLLRRTLSGAGYVSIASTMNPREVLELHRKNRYDLIVLDLQMPDMDGFEVMESLKEIEMDGYLPVLVITAQRHRTQERNRDDALERLVELIRAASVRPTPRRPTRPTLGSKVRRLEGKKRRAGVKAMRQGKPVVE